MICKLLKNQKKSFSQIKKCFSTQTYNESLNLDIKEKDPVIYNIIEEEKGRQKYGINLIASENHCSQAVLDALGSPLVSKFSSGQVGNRWNPGTRLIDQIEELCMNRALQAFNLNPEEWGVNVQAYSGCHANFYVYGALLKTHERILGLDLPHGGHLSHGFQVKGKKISMVSQFFDSYPYKLNEETGQINYEQMKQIAESYFPQIIVAGASAYSRLIDYKYFKEVSDSVGAYLLADMSHISGLVAAGVVPSPFEYSDIVTTTTHKSLRGPRGSLIFYRKGVRSVDKKGKKTMYDLENPINFSVSPMHQNSAINNQVAAIAVALKQANSSEFKEYQQQVLKNSSAYANKMTQLGYSLVSGGTDNHLCLINLKEKGLDGSRSEKLLDVLKIYGNKNTVPGDKSALNPGGYRVGSPAMTTRGLQESDFEQVALFMDKALQLIPKLKKECGGKKIVDFANYIQQNQQDIPEIVNLQNEIRAFAEQFPVPSIN